MLVVGAIICVAAITLIYRDTRQITSQAFINAPIVTVRAPIPGRTKLATGVQVGRRMVKGEDLGTIVADTENPRISELASRIAELIAQRTARQSEVNAIDAQLAHRRRELAGQNQLAGAQQVID